jgi:hypothetical protein
LKTHLDPYVQWARTHNSLAILTWDEDGGSNGNHVATVYAGQSVVPGQYAEHITHYSVLRTVEDAYGLSPLAGAGTVTPITDVWFGAPPPPSPSPSLEVTSPSPSASASAAPAGGTSDQLPVLGLGAALGALLAGLGIALMRRPRVAP